jgi:chromosomal replication initiation ATPase DnaA
MNEIEVLKQVVSEHCEVENIFTRRRKTELVTARQIMMKIMRDELGYKLAFIGHIFGQDHTTVIYAVRTANDLINTKNHFFYSRYVNVLYDPRVMLMLSPIDENKMATNIY